MTARRQRTLVQEALMQVYRSWRRRAPDVAHGGAYVRRAVVNEYLRRRRLRASGEIVTSRLPESAAVDEFDDAVVERDAMWRALAALPARQRAVLVLRYYEALPDREIASLIGCKEATVRSLALRALTALRGGGLVVLPAAEGSAG